MPEDSFNQSLGLRGRESLFDRRVQELRTTGQLQKPQPSALLKKKRTSEFDETISVRASQQMKAVSADEMDELERNAFIDEQTGLFNERSVARKLDQQLTRARRFKQPLSMVLLVIDGFENFAAEAQSMTVEIILKNLSQDLTKNVRDVDIVGTVAPGRFMILCPETSLEQVFRQAERVVNLISMRAITDQSHTWSITVSCGVSAYPEHGKESESLLKAASEAAATAVHKGGNRIEVVAGEDFSPSDLFKPANSIQFDPKAENMFGPALHTETLPLSAGS